MEGEPVDRRGLLGDMFRQAGRMVLPSIPSGGPPPPAEPPASARLPLHSASVEQLRASAVELGLGARVDAVRALARRSLRLAVEPGAGGEALLFGGEAPIGEDTEWPSWQGRPLTLLAQVDTGQPLGRLLFFYDAVGRPSGCLAAHGGSARVLQANDAPLARRRGPSMPAAGTPGAIGAELVLPRPASQAVAALELTRAEQEAWQALREELSGIQGTELGDRRGAGFTSVHRVYGYPDIRSDEMPLTCELAAAGEDVVEGRARMHRRAAEMTEQAVRWELVAQLSWDARLGWPWAAQRIYFWADRDALAAGELDGVWAIAR